ncbi:MAG: O-antigen polymerase [Ramlibacter sp.]|nr:O-antigen polymerase [Ramlibacter sp.]
MTEAGVPLQSPQQGVNTAAGLRASHWAVFALLLLPWLNARASGPSSSVEPWLVSALCGAVAYGLARPLAPHRAIAIALAAFAAWTMARSGISPETLGVAGACLLVFMGAALGAGATRDAGFVDMLAWAWLAAALASTVIALLQYFGVADAFTPWVSTTTVGEAFANLRQRNQFASLTVIGMASLLWLYPGRLGRWPAFAAMAWLAMGDASTTSRTGLAQMLLLGLLACAWTGPRRQRAMLWLAGFVAYVVAALLLPWLLEVSTGVAGNRLWERVAAVDACSSRTVLWSNVAHLVAQKPWLGWGWGELDYAHFTTLYDGARFCDILDNAHNLPLHLAVELGIPAAVLVCGGLLWAVLRARPWRESDPARQMAWAVLAMIAMHSLLEYPLWYGPFQIAFGLCLGLLSRASIESPQQNGSSPLRARAASWLVAACVAAATAYAAWDYRRVSQIYLPPETRMAAYRDDPIPLIRDSWLFRNQARFAELTIAPLTHENAQWMFDNARALLHYSPEPRVVEKLIESATVLGRQDEVLPDLARYRAAFPEAYEKWSKTRPERGAAPPPGQPAT